MKRRIFIRNTALTALSPWLLRTLSACGSGKTGRRKVFVFVQLIGGNDGLNTLIPLTDYGKLVAARPNLHIPEKRILPLKGTSDVGLHPALGALQDMYAGNLLSFVQGVGYETPNYSHFRSSDIYLTGSAANEVLYTGWMARYLETLFPGYPQGFPDATRPHPPAIKIGDTGTYLFQGTEMDMSLVLDPSEAFTEPEPDEPAGGLATPAGQEVESIRAILAQTKKYAPAIKQALAHEPRHSAWYPGEGKNSLADQLKMVSRLIQGGLESEVYMVDLKGFDTHDRQVDASDSCKGLHADLLAQISQALHAFWDDIAYLGREHEVAGMVFSEFGRRIMSNASFGTDHGSSQPLLFFGAGVNAGIIGHTPALPDKPTVHDNLAMQYDFRAVYASLLKGWFGATPEAVKKAIPRPFDEIPIFNPTNL